MNAPALLRCAAFVLGSIPFVAQLAARDTVSDLTYPSLDLVYPIEALKGAAEEITKKADDLKTPAPTPTPKAPTPTPSPSGMEVKETATELKISLLGDILFDYDKADIRSAAEPTLAQVAALIQKQPNANVLIEGHTDSKGSQSYNAKLSEKRAASVKTWLVKKGIADGSIWTRGLGAEKPVAPNSRPDGSDDPQGRQQNRRVEITVKK